jgi:hypothetical protein
MIAWQPRPRILHRFQLEGRILLVARPDIGFDLQHLHDCVQLLALCQRVLPWLPEHGLRQGDEPGDQGDQQVRRQVRRHPGRLHLLSPDAIANPRPPGCDFAIVHQSPFLGGS